MIHPLVSGQKCHLFGQDRPGKREMVVSSREVLAELGIGYRTFT